MRELVGIPVKNIEKLLRGELDALIRTYGKEENINVVLFLKDWKLRKAEPFIEEFKNKYEGEYSLKQKTEIGDKVEGYVSKIKSLKEGEKEVEEKVFKIILKIPVELGEYMEGLEE